MFAGDDGSPVDLRRRRACDFPFSSRDRGYVGGNSLSQFLASGQLGKSEEIPYALLLGADPSKELVEKYLKSSEIYVARLANEIIGVYVLYPINSEKAEIKNIAVEEKFQGKGVGKLLLEDAFKLAKAKGYKQLIIGTGNSSVGQLYLYQKAGFEMTEIRWNFFIDNYPDPLYEDGIQVKHMIVLSKQL